jgi:hypothetical protein
MGTGLSAGLRAFELKGGGPSLNVLLPGGVKGGEEGPNDGVGDSGGDVDGEGDQAGVGVTGGPSCGAGKPGPGVMIVPPGGGPYPVGGA